MLDLPGWAVRPAPDGAAVGRWPQARDTLRTDLGNTSDGPASIDLCRDGPHALVAGTTGSGKSELLQSLIAGLALNHPPERCSFLLVDYKGGAAFAEAARLPHTVGLLTDLDGSTTARALRSLAAELSRREALLAAHGVPDLAALPASVELARLVIVVDEFATLVEELPGFVPGLVGIAQRGRSLGIHLVLATQRPGGVVSPRSGPTARCGSACAPPTRPTPATSSARRPPRTCRSTCPAARSSAPATHHRACSRSPGWPCRTGARPRSGGAPLVLAAARRTLAARCRRRRHRPGPAGRRPLASGRAAGRARPAPAVAATPARPARRRGARPGGPGGRR